MVLEALDQAAGEDAPVGTAITAAAGRPASPTLVPVARYVSPEFAELERTRLWPRVWQVACILDHVRAPGDYFEYRVGPFSVLIVRDDAGDLRAFQNVCRHRGALRSRAALRRLRLRRSARAAARVGARPGRGAGDSR